MADLVEWLTAQLDADEAIARAAAEESTSARWVASEGSVYPEDNPSRHPGPFASGVYGELSEGVAGHIVYNDPAAVLRTIAAHRAILGVHEHEYVPKARKEYAPNAPTGFGCTICHEDDSWLDPRGWCDTVRALASIYESRDGFDPSWKVET